MTADLTVGVVKNACVNAKKTKGIILHTDLESQYTSDLFENYLNKKGI